ncbi:MAG: aspartate-semialdehyde dehydrogenase [Planctomycetes bacterium]|nr:aspartate-semialdehyde dehydrogenase [Planctomycetota bacterium]
MPERPRIAIVGATGAVGRELLSLLEERRFPCAAIRLLASSRSAGTAIRHGGESIVVEELTERSFEGIDLALFSAGGSISRRFAPAAVAAGATVIDNSSCFRMNDDVPLVVPEINGDELASNRFAVGRGEAGIIANPNCSTIIALMAVTPLHRAVGVRRMVVSTYQAASGAGAALMAELEQQARDYAEGRPYTTDICGRQYLFNVFSHDSPVGDDGYNEEERKLLRETHRIWNDDNVRVSATCVRVPVLRAHAEAIHLTLDAPLDEAAIRGLLDEAPGVRVLDDRAANRFPEPIDAAGRDEVLVGRIRTDVSEPDGRGVALFACGDQLRKGAALNAIQIAEWLLADEPARGA